MGESAYLDPRIYNYKKIILLTKLFKFNVKITKPITLSFLI